MTDAKQSFDPHACIAPTARLLGLPVETQWEDAIATNLMMMAQAAELVGSFPLPDEMESALVFKPL